MSVGALAGFVLVFVVTTVAMSAVGALALTAARRWLRRVGPLAEKRAAETAAIVPVVVGIVVLSALVVQGTLGLDHCQRHDHHAHLCFTHGGAWIERTWIVVTLAVTAAIFVARAVIMTASYVRGAHSIHELHRVSRHEGNVSIVESARAFCFVARRGVFVSSRVWSSLPANERAAVVAHEHAHMRRGDLGRRFVLELLLLFAAPFVADRVRGTWLRAGERLCDADAAAATDPETVATAMVSMCRLGGSPPVPAFGFTPAANELAGRIQAVLAGEPLGERAAVRLVRTTLVLCAATAIASIAAAEPIHHAFETLLG